MEDEDGGQGWVLWFGLTEIDSFTPKTRTTERKPSLERKVMVWFRNGFKVYFRHLNSDVKYEIGIYEGNSEMKSSNREITYLLLVFK